MPSLAAALNLCYFFLTLENSSVKIVMCEGILGGYEASVRAEK